jgi:hypothetical protein
LIALLLPFLTACGDAGVPDEPDGFSLRPSWRPQEKVEIREERVQLEGRGPFPAAADLEALAKKREREVDVYEDTVLTGVGVELDAIIRRYLSSVLTVDGESRETVVHGKTYMIVDPLGKCEVQRELESREMVGTSEEEQTKIRRSILRIAASLLPRKRVREGESWIPGRELSKLALKGRVEAEMRARLQSVEEKDGRRLATIMCDLDARIPDGKRIGAHIVARETLLFDLDGGRVTTYHAVTERSYPKAPRRQESWVRTVTDVSVTKKR